MKKIVALILSIFALSSPTTTHASARSARLKGRAQKIAAKPRVQKVLKRLNLTPEDPESVENSFVIADTVTSEGYQEQKPRKSLRMLYQTDVGLFSRRTAVKGKVNKVCRLYFKSNLSKRAIKPFIKKHNINVDEIEKPVREYKTFNAFFTRKLKPGARKIEGGANALVSLADCSLTAIKDVSNTDHFMIKGTKFTVPDFLNNTLLAQEYKDGTLLIFRLAPEDYHRFHFPFDCTPSEPTIIKGIYDSVNPLVYKAGFQPLVTNERHLVQLQTRRFSTVLMVAVGALCVGRIKETYTPNEKHKKGDEAGYFAHGGSTVGLLFKKGMVRITPQILANTRDGIETKVRVGQVIGWSTRTR